MPCQVDTLLGYAGTTLAILFDIISGISVQLAERVVGDFELNFIRHIVGAFIFGLLLLVTKERKPIQKECWPYLLLITLAKFTVNLTYYAAMSFMPFTHVAGAAQSFLAFAVVIISKIYYDEPIGRHLLPTLGCIVGMLSIVQPWWGFSKGFIPMFLQDTEAKASNETGIFIGEGHPGTLDMMATAIFGYSLSFLAAVADAVFLIFSFSKLKSINATSQCFVMACLSIPLSLMFCVYLEEIVIILDPNKIFLLLSHSVAIGLGTILFIASVKLIGPTQLSVFLNLETVLYLIPQYTLMASSLSGRMNILEVFGCCLIMLSLTFSVLTTTSKEHEDF